MSLYRPLQQKLFPAPDLEPILLAATLAALLAGCVRAAAIVGGQGAKRLRGERACAEHEHEERCPCADAVRERRTTSVQVSTSHTAWRALR